MSYISNPLSDEARRNLADSLPFIADLGLEDADTGSNEKDDHDKKSGHGSKGPSSDKRSGKKSQKSDVSDEEKVLYEGKISYVRGIWPDAIKYIQNLFKSDRMAYADVINLLIYCVCDDPKLKDEWASRLSSKQLGLIKNYATSGRCITEALSEVLDNQEAILNAIKAHDHNLNKKLEKVLFKQDSQMALSSYDLMDRKGWYRKDEVESASIFRSVPGPDGNGDPDVVVKVVELGTNSVPRLRSQLNDAEGREIGKAVGNKSMGNKIV